MNAYVLKDDCIFFGQKILKSLCIIALKVSRNICYSKKKKLICQWTIHLSIFWFCFSAELLIVKNERYKFILKMYIFTYTQRFLVRSLHR